MDINDTVAPFKRDVRAKEAINLDEDILPHEKNGERRNDQFWRVELRLDKTRVGTKRE